MNKTSKDVRMNIRVDEDLRDDFHIASKLRGSSAADELPRERSEGKGEVEKLLANCTGRRAHLGVYILLAIDTALRPEERLRITAADVDFENRIIIARATNTKTNRRRLVPLSDRLADALKVWLTSGLREWLIYSPAHGKIDHVELLSSPTTTIFANVKSIKTAWRSLLQSANLTNIQPRDLRHWATTEMVKALAESGEDRSHGMRITGHSQEKTFRRYITTDLESVERARLAMERRRKIKT